jgi:ribose 1,5-bisphosphate isomerase
MHSQVAKTVKDIKSLKIQGARNIAKAAVHALALQMKLSKAKNSKTLLLEMFEVAEALKTARPTEPMLRNSIDQMMEFLKETLDSCSIKEAKAEFASQERVYQEKVEKNAHLLMDYGAKIIPSGATVITHCHSSTVTGIMKHAKKLGTEFEVISCETRPRFQGRITAKELADYGIKVTQIVDGAVNVFMKKADLVIVGADAITARGDLINKIGTSMVAHLARMHEVSFYSAAELYKYSPSTLFGNLEKIEERDPKEVWDKAPKKVKVSNMAFDVTSSRFISGYITEAGVIPPQSFFALATEKVGIKIYK